MDAGQVGRGVAEAFVASQHAGHHGVDLAAASDHAQVAMRLPDQVAKRFLVAGVVTGEDENEVGVAQIGEGDVELVDVVGLGGRVRERRMLEQFFSVVEHHDAKVSGVRDRGQRLSNMPATDEDQTCRRLQMLHENLHCAAAAHREIPNEVGLDRAGAAVSQRVAARVDDLGFDGAAAHSADHLAVLMKKKLGADRLRGRTRTPDHGGERCPPTRALEDIDDFAGQLGWGDTATQRRRGVVVGFSHRGRECSSGPLPAIFEGMGTTALRWSLLSGAIGVAGCQEPYAGVCDGEGAAGVEVFQRGEPDEVLDGSDVPVFPPPQGGVFTELDVRLLGVTTDEIVSIRVDIFDAGGDLLAAQLYAGDGLPLACQPDASILIEDMPVGFNASVVLEELEGVDAAMTIRLAHDGGDTEVERAVTLRVTDY